MKRRNTVKPSLLLPILLINGVVGCSFLEFFNYKKHETRIEIGSAPLFGGNRVEKLYRICAQGLFVSLLLLSGIASHFI